MGDTSIIARRLQNGDVQHGWCGNGGYISNVGRKLLNWYNTPDMVDYLFNLGQLSWLGAPHSEHGGYHENITTQCTGYRHWLGPSERIIFSKIPFIDYGYFYDWDQRWYYVAPGPFRIKYPLELLINVLHSGISEYDFSFNAQRRILTYILQDYPKQDSVFQKLLSEYKTGSHFILEELLSERKRGFLDFFEEYNTLYRYFDDWIIGMTDEHFTIVTEYIIKQKTPNRQETIDW